MALYKYVYYYYVYYHLVNFTFYYKNAKSCNISATVQPISTQFNIMTQTTAILKIEKLQYFMIIQNRSLKRIGRPPSWIYIQRGMHLRDTFWSSCQILLRQITPIKEISQFFRSFLVKCKHSLDDRA